jgi:hypothetical protein
MKQTMHRIREGNHSPRKETLNKAAYERVKEIIVDRKFMRLHLKLILVKTTIGEKRMDQFILGL